MKLIQKDKKAVSVMIGYIILITIAVIISTIVYQQLRTYVPSDALECVDGVSILVRDVSYNCTSNELDFTLKNNGRFGVGGYFIKATESPADEIATTDLSEYHNLGSGGALILDLLDSNSLKPEDESHFYFDLSSSPASQFYSIELIPIRFEEFQNQDRLVSCTNAKVKETLNCASSGDSEGSGEEESEQSLIGYFGFESGEQGWGDQGSDSERVNERSIVQDDGSLGGTWSFRIRDNTGSSSTLRNFDFQGYTEVSFKFEGYYESFEPDECVELKVDGVFVESWGNDIDLTHCTNHINQQDTWLSHQVILSSLDHNFDSSVNILFEGEMDDNDDLFYIDAINVTGISQ